MNKNTKIWLNYIAGAGISLFLLWNIYSQVMKQLSGPTGNAWRQTGPGIYLWLSAGLMMVNTSLEGTKWYLLSRSVSPLPYLRAYASYLVGIACSIITPNRIGDYPGRILYLGNGNTLRYVNVAVLGAVSQLSAIFIFGLGSLIYYNIAFPALLAKAALALCIIVNVCIAVVYWKFEAWVPKLARFRWLQRFAVYGRLLNKVTALWQLQILGLSVLRFAVVTAQYLFLLRWMNVDIPLGEGFLMAALFFWVMAVVPSVALSEIGVRGAVSVYLFQHFSGNTVGIIAATMGIWLLNLMIPSIAGSILMIRMRLLR